MSKLVKIEKISEQTGIPVRTLRSFVSARKIPYLKCGHRTLLFDLSKVEGALQRFEIEAVGSR